MGKLLAIKISVDEIKISVDYLCLQMVFDQIKPCEVVSLSLMVISREDCRNVETIAASS